MPRCILAAGLLGGGLLLAAGPACHGQRFIFRPGERLLYFRKNGHRETAYGVGEVLSFTVRGSRERVSGRIQGFEGDSVLVLAGDYRVPVRAISALFVDDKTRQWYLLRYKYEPLAYLGGTSFLVLNTFHTRRVEGRALKLSGALLGAGLLAHFAISQKLRLTGRRRLLIIAR